MEQSGGPLITSHIFTVTMSMLYHQPKLTNWEAESSSSLLLMEQNRSNMKENSITSGEMISTLSPPFSPLSLLLSVSALSRDIQGGKNKTEYVIKIILKQMSIGINPRKKVTDC